MKAKKKKTVLAKESQTQEKAVNMARSLVIDRVTSALERAKSVGWDEDEIVYEVLVAATELFLKNFGEDAYIDFTESAYEARVAELAQNIPDEDRH